MKQLSLDPWLAFACVGGVLYPPLVYFGLSALPSTILVLVAVALIGVRYWGMRKTVDVRRWLIALGIGGVGLLTIGALNASLAVKAYPIVVSLSVAAVFGLSLLYPPTIIERIARVTEPSLSAEGVQYTRRVTVAWVVFLIMNAGVSAATAVWGSLQQWTLWNGLISYVLMGMLFIGERFVRKAVRP